MRHKKRLIALLITIVVLTVVQYTFAGHPGRVYIYDKYIFHPYQSFRNLIFGGIPFSLGDVLYVAGGAGLLFVVGRWVYFIFKFKMQRHNLVSSVIHTVITTAALYILFVVGWGANYYKPPLGKYWGLYADTVKMKDTTIAARFDEYLVGRLNAYALHYHDLTFKEVNRRSQQYYLTYTNCRSRLSGLGAKPSVFGNMMQHFGIQGYYNPFTGESQVNRHLPAFMLPFVVCHEIAHQAGIAAEGDANLLSYAVGTAANDTSFNYSCYFNIWIYAHNRLYRRNSALAKSLEQQLNSLTKAHIDTLEAIRRRYNSDLNEYSSMLYDQYLRLHDQKDGIHSYGSVSASAWLLEQRRKTQGKALIPIP